ncbi:MAG: hypothetical protein ACOCQR_03215 [bacterium]
MKSLAKNKIIIVLLVLATLLYVSHEILAIDPITVGVGIVVVCMFANCGPGTPSDSEGGGGGGDGGGGGGGECISNCGPTIKNCEAESSGPNYRSYTPSRFTQTTKPSNPQIPRSFASFINYDEKPMRNNYNFRGLESTGAPTIDSLFTSKLQLSNTANESPAFSEQTNVDRMHGQLVEDREKWRKNQQDFEAGKEDLEQAERTCDSDVDYWNNEYIPQRYEMYLKEHREFRREYDQWVIDRENYLEWVDFVESKVVQNHNSNEYSKCSSARSSCLDEHDKNKKSSSCDESINLCASCPSPPSVPSHSKDDIRELSFYSSYLQPEPMHPKQFTADERSETCVRNLPPIINNMAVLTDLSEVKQGDEIHIRAEVIEPDGDDLKYEWSAEFGEIINNGRDAIYIVPTNQASLTQDSVTLSVTDLFHISEERHTVSKTMTLKTMTESGGSQISYELIREE